MILNGEIKVPVFGVVTDFTIHRWWVYPEISHYFIAMDDLLSTISNYGFFSLNVSSPGIPIREQFNRKFDRKELQVRYRLDPGRKTVLVMGGGAGVLPMEEIIKACDKSKVSLQYLVVCGNNKQLFKKIELLKNRTESLINVFGFVNYIAELMAIADIIISKPGGVSSSEAIASELPMIIFKPIPGQEEANTRYLVNNRLALRVQTFEELESLLHELFSLEAETISVLKRNMLEKRRPHAAAEIVKFTVAYASKTGAFG